MPKEEIDPILVEEYRIKLGSMIGFLGVRWVLHEAAHVFRTAYCDNIDGHDAWIAKTISDLLDSIAMLLYAAERDSGEDEEDTDDTEGEEADGTTPT